MMNSENNDSSPARGEAGWGGSELAPNAPHPLPLPALGEGKQCRVLFLALSGIGNLIMQLPAIAAVKKAHPTWHITVWVAPKGTKAIAESQAFIDEVLEMQVANLPADLAGRVHAIKHHIKNILLLRKHHFDIGIVLSPGQLVKSAAYMFLAGIPMRIGNSYPLRSNRRSKLFLTHAINELENIHDIEQNIKLLEPLGLADTKAPYYSLEIPDSNIQEAEGLFSTISYNLSFDADTQPASVQPIESLLGIHAGCAAGFEWKRWPLSRFAEVAIALIRDNPKTRIIVFGGKDEAEQNIELVGMINEACHAIFPEPRQSQGRGDNNYAVVLGASLLTTAAIMKKCTFFLANDSGLMHIAAAVGVPTLGLFGPTSEVLTGPRGSHSTVLRAQGTVPVYNTESGNTLGNTSHESLLKISVQMVLDEIAKTNI